MEEDGSSEEGGKQMMQKWSVLFPRVNSLASKGMKLNFIPLEFINGNTSLRNLNSSKML